MNVRVHTHKKLSVHKPIVIVGFPGVGLVGSIAAKYLAQQLKAKPIGHIQSTHIPPVSFIVDGEVCEAIRIYESKKHNVIIIESEFPLPAEFVHPLGDAIADWCKRIGAKQVVCLEGVNAPTVKNKPKVYVATSGSKNDTGLETVKNGYIIGVSASLMLRVKEINIPALCLMAESHVGYPDGIAAASVLDELSSLFNIKINTKPLVSEAEEFENKLKKLVEKAHEIKSMSKDGKIIYG